GTTVHGLTGALGAATTAVVVPHGPRSSSEKSPTMNRHERLLAILRLITTHESVHVDQVMTELGVSAATVRRDLDNIAQQQLITRTRGGARTSPNSSDLPFRYKSSGQSAEKQRIASAAAALIKPGDVVGLNGGTTTTEVARELVLRDELHGQDSDHQVV